MEDCINIITAGRSGRSRLVIPRDKYVDYFYEDVSITVRQLQKEDKLDYLLLYTSKYIDILKADIVAIKSSRDLDSALESCDKEGEEECIKVIKNITNALYVITICVTITDGATRFPTLIEFLCSPKESREVALDHHKEEELSKFLKNEVRTSIYDFYKSASKSSTVNEINSEKEILSIFAKHIEHIPYVDIICRCDDNIGQIDQHEEIPTYKFG